MKRKISLLVFVCVIMLSSCVPKKDAFWEEMDAAQEAINAVTEYVNMSDRTIVYSDEVISFEYPDHYLVIKGAEYTSLGVSGDYIIVSPQVLLFDNINHVKFIEDDTLITINLIDHGVSTLYSNYEHSFSNSGVPILLTVECGHECSGAVGYVMELQRFRIDLVNIGEIGPQLKLDEIDEFKTFLKTITLGESK